MSQEDVLKIIKVFRGEATSQQIKDYAKKKYPHSTLHLYVSNRLKKLQENNLVKYENGKWKLMKTT